MACGCVSAAPTDDDKPWTTRLRCMSLSGKRKGTPLHPRSGAMMWTGSNMERGLLRARSCAVHSQSGESSSSLGLAPWPGLHRDPSFFQHLLLLRSIPSESSRGVRSASSRRKQTARPTQGTILAVVPLGLPRQLGPLASPSNGRSRLPHNVSILLRYQEVGCA